MSVRSGLPALLLLCGLATLPFLDVPAPPATLELELPRRAAVGYSNIHPGDYVGPETCAECHPKKYALWRGHPHSSMNLDASPETVLGDFSGLELEYAGGAVRFEQTVSGYGMTLKRGGETRSYRVTRTVGSRFTQMYIGVQTLGPEALDDPIYRNEGKLPFGYWLDRKAWFPEVYFDSDCPPEYQPDGTLSLPSERAHRTTWRDNCIYCHNTYPYEERLRAGRGTTGFPEEDLSLSATVAPGDPPGLSPARLVTLGISCESCHFGGREHAIGGKAIRFVPSSPALQFPKGERARGRDDPYVVNSICSQCHFSRGVSSYPNGAGVWNSREAVDLANGGCASQIKCTDCHDPHVPSVPGGGPTHSAHVQTCLGCHPGLQSDEHSQHPAEVSCLDCHMPRIVQGLEAVVRTHQISSPGDPRMLAAGAPNACNLCHLERSIEWTVAALKIGWAQTIEPEPSWQEPYGGRLSAPVGQAWISSPEPNYRLVAADAYSRSPLGQARLQNLIRALDDPQAVNRMFGLFALERVLGRRLSKEEYAPVASPATRREQVAKLLARYP